MIWDGISLTVAPLVTALIGTQVKVPPDYTPGRFALSATTSLATATFFALRLHLEIHQKVINPTLLFPIYFELGAIKVQEFIFIHFFGMAFLMYLLSIFLDKVSNTLIRGLLIGGIVFFALLIASSAIILPVNFIATSGGAK